MTARYFSRVFRTAFLFGAALMAIATRAAPIRYQSVVFDAVDVQRDVAFRTATNDQGASETLMLDVYRPKGDSERSRPAILWLHGGGFRPGNDKTQGYIVTMSTEFAKRGYVSIASNYRVSAAPRDIMQVIQNAVDDSRAALAWIKSHAEDLGIDPRRIAVGGGSAGGVVAVSLVAVENAAARQNQTQELFALIVLWGSPMEDFMVGKVGDYFPPTVIVHGTADPTFTLSEKFAATLKGLAVKHTLMAIPDAPHTPTQHMPAILETTSAFVSDALTEAASAK